jgi:hypothetical protein
MTEQTGPSKRPAGPPAGRMPWFRLALLKTIVGCALGLFSSAAVIWFTHKAFPQVGEFSVDVGLKLKMSLDRLKHLSTGLPKKDADASFVFLDVDPKHEGASVCTAIAKNFAQPLDCHSARPLNRYVLAKLIDDLQDRKPSLIVLDVTLAYDYPVVPKEESKALAKAMGSSKVPIVYAAPAELNWREGDVDSAPEVEVDAEDMFPAELITSKPEDNTANKAHAAIAFPEADQPLRRYRKCYAVAGSNVAAYTLPWLAAELLSKPRDAKLGPCNDSDNPVPRIIYTIPPIDGHQDMQLTSERAQWAFYRNVYTRCLVSKFWEENRSRCGKVDDVTSLYEGKVVVIGASNPGRRDWHYTPLGNMAGPEVVVNAIRSFQKFSKQPEPTAFETFRHEALIVMTCSLLWLLFHSLRYGTAGAVSRRLAPLTQVKRALFVGGAFVATLLLVLGVTIHMSFESDGPAPSLSILVGVLAITAEQYVDAMEWVLHRVSEAAARLLGISKEAGH